MFRPLSISLITLFLAFGCGNGNNQAIIESSPVSRFKVVVTEGGQEDFEFGELGEINTRLCVLFDRMTDSTVVKMAMYEFAFDAVIFRLLDNLRKHPGAKAELLFDPTRFASPFPPHRVPLIDSLRLFVEQYGNLTVANLGDTKAGLLNPEQPSERKLMHNKFLLFTHPSPFEGDSSSEILAVSTANIAYAEVAESNELVFLRDFHALNAAFSDYFDDLKSKKSHFQGKTASEGPVKAWFFPFPKGTPDVMETELAALAQRVQQNQGPGAPPTRIRIGMPIWDDCRKGIAEQLVQMHTDLDADIKIMLREDPDISPNILRILHNLPDSSVRFLPVRHPKAHYGLHSKFLIAEYPQPAGQGYETGYLTYMGSHNWNYDAHYVNAESMIRVEGVDVYYPLWAHWQTLWESGIDSTRMYDTLPNRKYECIW